MSTCRRTLPPGAGLAVLMLLCGALPASAVSPPSFAAAVTRNTGSPARAVAIADVNGDGRRDVIVSTGWIGDPATDGKLLVFPQTAAGLLGASVPHTTDLIQGDAAGLDAADLNGDGRADVALATGSGVDVFYQSGGRLLPPVLLPQHLLQQLVIGRVAGDGKNDIVARTATRIVLFTSAGSSFTRSVVARAQTPEVETGDVTGDGLADVVDIHGGRVRVYAQRATGGFAAPVVYEADLGMFPGGSISGLDIADVTGDGKKDAVVSVVGYSPAMEVLPQLPTHVLGAPITYAAAEFDPTAVESADVDGDGLLDPATAYDGGSAVAIRLQQTNGLLGGELDVPVPYTTAYDTQGLALRDFSGDGKVDIALAAGEGHLVIVRQT